MIDLTSGAEWLMVMVMVIAADETGLLKRVSVSEWELKQLSLLHLSRQ